MIHILFDIAGGIAYNVFFYVNIEYTATLVVDV